MQILNAYKYEGANGSITTLVELPTEGQKLYRLVAEQGMILTNGIENATVIDISIEDLETWSEIEFVRPEDI